MDKNWPLGFRFFYKSKYNDGIVQGVIDNIIDPGSDGMSEGSIRSTNGVWYKMSEVEIETLSDIRNDKLEDLGI